MGTDHVEAHGRCPGWRETVLDYLGFLRAAVAADSEHLPTRSTCRPGAHADPVHPWAQEIVGMLSIRSEEFRQLWARHDVRESVHGSEVFRHPQVGELHLGRDAYTRRDVPGRS